MRMLVRTLTRMLALTRTLAGMHSRRVEQIGRRSPDMGRDGVAAALAGE